MEVRKFILYFIVACIAIMPVKGFATSDISTGSALRFDEPISVIIEDDYRGGGDLELVNVETEQVRVSPTDANGLKAIMLTLIGDYEMTVKDYTYQSQQGYTSHSITIERDWSWIMTCALFIVVIYCVFRAVGGILCK